MNVVYAIECVLCGLVYIGETMAPLNTRINGHRYQINKNGNQLIYQHFNQPDHSILSMKVRFIEKIYHPSNSPKLSTPLRRKREEYWIKELGTATPYGCNDKVDSVGNLSSPACSSTNVMELFNTSSRRRRSHGQRHYTRPILHDISFRGLIKYVNAPLGLHHIRTKLFSLPLSRLNTLRNQCLVSSNTDQYSLEYRLTGVILDIAKYRLYKPAQTNQTSQETRSFLKIKFENKGIDAINISNILHNKHVKSKVPAYCGEQSVPRISYTYTNPVASKIFNHKNALKDVNVHDIKSKPPSCNCSTSQYKYDAAAHIITGDLNIVSNDMLRQLLAKGPKYREAQPINWNHTFKLLMDSVESYARGWAKREEVEADTLSEWVKTIRSFINARIRRLKRKMSCNVKSVLKDPAVAKCLSDLHEKFVIVPADKASNNIVFVCKYYYYLCLIDELGINNTQGNPTYTRITCSKKEVINNHESVLTSFGIETTKKNLNLPALYWTPKLHKCPYKQRYIAGSAVCSTKPLSVLLTKLLTAVKEGLQKYCDTAYSRNGVNQMWILKNSKELIENLKSRSFSTVTSIKTFDFSTLYTTIPHSKLKKRLKDLIFRCFFRNNGKRRYKYLVLGYPHAYFVQENTASDKKFTEHEVVGMLEFLIDNIFVEFGGEIFQQTVGIPMGTNCAPLLADLFLYSYEADFIQMLLKRGDKKLACSFNYTYRYIDDVLSLNNSKFSDYLHVIYPDELQIKDTTDSSKSAAYLDLYLEIDHKGTLCTRLYDKRDDFNFPIINFPVLSSNIPASPAYGVYVSQLIRYARACTHYQEFLVRGKRLTDKLLKQEYCKPRLMTTFKKFYGRHRDLVDRYGLSVTQMINDMIGSR